MSRQRFAPRFAGLAAILAAAAPGPTFGHGHDRGGHHGHGPVPVPGRVGGFGGYGVYPVPFYASIGPGGFPFVYVPPTFAAVAPGIFPVPMFDRGPVGGPVPAAMLAPRPVPVPPAAPKAPASPAKISQVITFGDRLFRAGNIKRAEERYEQALKLDAASASPRVRLAQVAVARGRYDEAAERYRDAIAAEPNWLAKAPDIQKIYGEPREFIRTIAKLESHLLLQPGDRDAWLVLGAQLYLSGQTRRASDVFVRLTDRRPDATLAAFLDATKPPALDTR